MKVYKKFTPAKFNGLKKIDMYDLWFRQGLTDKQIAILYGVPTSEVKEKRRKLGVKFWACAKLALYGTEEYKLYAKKRINIS